VDDPVQTRFRPLAPLFYCQNLPNIRVLPPPRSDLRQRSESAGVPIAGVLPGLVLRPRLHIVRLSAFIDGRRSAPDCTMAYHDQPLLDRR